MASLRELKLPPVADKDGNLVWDETIGSGEPSSRPWEHPSICFHAMAHGSVVCGIGSSSSEDWITWKTSFAPHKVYRVASNHDGSIIVAATDGGTVSLLRARDGKVLATRRVSMSGGTHRPAEVAFVADAHLHQSKDVLIILVPTADQLANDTTDVNAILVSNIDGKRLNNDNVETVAEAAKNMSIDALKLNAHCKDIETLQGCFLNAATVRFAAGEADGNVSIHDYDVETKRPVLVCKKIEAGEEEPTFLTSLDMRLQHCGNDTTFLLLCGHSNTHTKLYWYDIVHLNMACDCILPTSPCKQTKPWLLALEPVKSFSDASALAVAVAMKESSSAPNGFVQVIQVFVEDTMGLAVLSSPHKVYQIPLNSSEANFSLQGIDLGALDGVGPYSFRFRTWFGCEHIECHEFITRDARIEDGVVGKIRLLIHRGMYDEADQLLAANDCDVLLSDPFAMFHMSEVALRRLQHLLSSGSLGSEESMERARECLRRLIAGAVSSNEIGQQHLIEAADSVSVWPTNVYSSKKPTVALFSVALSAMITAFQTALQSANTDIGPKLKGKKKELEERLSTMKCIEALLETDSSEIVLDTPFLESRSPSDVFLVLMEEGFFSVAEKLWRSEWGRELTAETSALSILSLLPSVDPRAYASVLKHAVFPRLTITHEAIPLIRAWACRCANAYDDHESELGLESSIYLLEVRTGLVA